MVFREKEKPEWNVPIYVVVFIEDYQISQTQLNVHKKYIRRHRGVLFIIFQFEIGEIVPARSLAHNGKERTQRSSALSFHHSVKCHSSLAVNERVCCGYVRHVEYLSQRTVEMC